MKIRQAVKAIQIIAVAGLLFSGYLSYMELWGGGCKDTFVRCDSSFSLFSLPACVYGFFMYLIILIITILGLREKK